MKLLFLILVALNALAFASATGWLGQSTPRGEPERISNQLRPHLIVLESGSSAQDRTPPPLASTTPENSGTAPAAPVASAEPVLTPSTTNSRQAEITAAPQPAPAVEVAQPRPSPAPIPETAEPVPVVPTAPATTPTPVTPAAPATPLSPMACLAFDGVREALVDQIERIASNSTAAVRVSRTMIEPASGWWVRIPPAASRAAADQRAAELRQSGINDLFVVRENGPDQSAISLGLFRTEAAARQHLIDLQRRRVTDASVTRRTPATYRVELRGPANVLQDITRSLPTGAASPSNLACRP